MIYKYYCYIINMIYKDNYYKINYLIITKKYMVIKKFGFDESNPYGLKNIFFDKLRNYYAKF